MDAESLQVCPIRKQCTQKEETQQGDELAQNTQHRPEAGEKAKDRCSRDGGKIGVAEAGRNNRGSRGREVGERRFRGERWFRGEGCFKGEGWVLREREAVRRGGLQGGGGF